MFTGIIEELGTIEAVTHGEEGMRLDIAALTVLADATVGDSIAVNGVCLTAVSIAENGFSVDVIPESLARSNLGTLEVGARVNLERPTRVNGRLDGHIVQGHVDGTAALQTVHHDEDGGVRLQFELPEELTPFVIEKGSITIDGVSLTVSALHERAFEVSLIPHTLEVTTLGDARPGGAANLEVDVIAKYVARYLDTTMPHNERKTDL